MKNIVGTDFMVSNVATFGSCVSRAIFNSFLNKDYKNFFNIVCYNEFVSMVSLMSEPIEYDVTLVNSTNYDNLVVENDFKKYFLKSLNNKNINYLIIDTYCDSTKDILLVGENSWITNSKSLQNCDISSKLNFKKKLNISTNTKEYFNLWKNSCNSFFEYLNVNYPNIQVILNSWQGVYKYYDNGKIHENETFKKLSYWNLYRDLFDEYILRNFDVDVLFFDKDTLFDPNFIFSSHNVHYEPRYYSDKLLQLNNIVRRNYLLYNNKNLNKIIRFLRRQKMIYEINDYDFLVFELELTKKMILGEIMSKNNKFNNKFENLQSKVNEKDLNIFLESVVEDLFNSSSLSKNYCPVCGNSFELFLPFNGRKKVACPECNSLERHRFLYYFIKYHTNMFSKNINLLDLTPEAPIKDNLFKNINYFELIGMDKDNFFKFKKLPFKDNVMNIIYSYNVFGNNYYDVSILKEICRVLKSNSNESFFICYVIDPNKNRDKINIKNHEEIYGYNVIKMLNDSGFDAKLYSISSLVNDEMIQKYGLSNSDHFFICTKKSLKHINNRSGSVKKKYI